MKYLNSSNQFSVPPFIKRLNQEEEKKKIGKRFFFFFILAEKIFHVFMRAGLFPKGKHMTKLCFSYPKKITS